jgi:hypothetical protein
MGRACGTRTWCTPVVRGGCVALVKRGEPPHNYPTFYTLASPRPAFHAFYPYPTNLIFARVGEWQKLQIIIFAVAVPQCTQEANSHLFYAIFMSDLA